MYINTDTFLQSDYDRYQRSIDVMDEVEEQRSECGNCGCEIDCGKRFCDKYCYWADFYHKFDEILIKKNNNEN